MKNMFVALLGLVLFSAANAKAASLEILKTQPVVQQEVLVKNFRSVCKDDRRYMESPVGCTVNVFDLKLPAGGTIVGAKTDSELVHLSVDVKSSEVRFSMWPNADHVINGGTEEQKQSIMSALAAEQIKMTLIYQGPALK